MDKLFLLILLSVHATDIIYCEENTTTDPSTETTPKSTNLTSPLVGNATTSGGTPTTMKPTGCNVPGKVCENNGTCTSTGTCECTEDFIGEMCHASKICPLGTCHDDGTANCTMDINFNDATPKCNCLPNYLGEKCEIFNYCSQHPCDNGGGCKFQTATNYSCDCVTGDPNQDCKLNIEDKCLLPIPAGGSASFIICINRIGSREMICAPGLQGDKCTVKNEPSAFCDLKGNDYCRNEGYCKPFCNVDQCNGTKNCEFTVSPFGDPVFNGTNHARAFADGYADPDSDNESALFDGFDKIRMNLEDCSPFYNTICTRNFSDGICNIICNNSNCNWDGGDCLSQMPIKLAGAVVLEFKIKPLAEVQTKLGLLLRTYINVTLKENAPEKYLLHIKTSGVGENEGRSFTETKNVARFLAAALAKLPYLAKGVTDVYMCEAGMFGDKCTQNCSSTCQRSGDVCDWSSGECLEGCQKGFWGKMCEKTCPADCLDGCNTHGQCIRCEVGKYGGECKRDCDQHCINNTCDVSKGICDCGTGRYSDAYICKECSKWCENPCDGKDGHCTCKLGYFGTQCNEKCSLNCKNQRCSVDGTCSNSCNDGFHGNKCDKKCPLRCPECQRNDGSCGGKCKDGYEGTNCQPKTHPPETSNTGVIIAIVIALLIIFAIIIGACCYWKRRQSGDYIVDDEEMESPVKKANTLEAKNNIGMQPVSPLMGRSADMIDMDERNSAAGVYAGPDRGLDIVTSSTVTASPDVGDGEPPAAQPSDVIKETENETTESSEGQKNEVKLTLSGERRVSTTVELTIEKGKNGAPPRISSGRVSSHTTSITEEEQTLSTSLAPLASEEDLLTDLGPSKQSVVEDHPDVFEEPANEENPNEENPNEENPNEETPLKEDDNHSKRSSTSSSSSSSSSSDDEKKKEDRITEM